MELASARSLSAIRRRLRRAAWALERRVDDLRWRLKARGARPLRLLSYRGHGNGEHMVVQGRVVEDRRLRRACADDSRWDNLKASYKRLFTREVPRVRVQARCGAARAETRTDADGYFRFVLDGGAHRRLWRTVALRVFDGAGRSLRGTGEVLVTPPDAQFGVISDIDDTILRSRAARALEAACLTVFGNAHTREPFSGVAPFYTALQQGTGRRRANPIFYLSGSPWNLYDLFEHFMEVHGLPKGPIILRDYGPEEGHLLESGYREHKLRAIEVLLRMYPALPFVLIGDSGQRDPEIYREAALDFPDRIPVIYIRDVSGAIRRRGVQGMAVELAAAGVDLQLVSDTAEATRHAASMGLIRGPRGPARRRRPLRGAPAPV